MAEKIGFSPEEEKDPNQTILVQAGQEIKHVASISEEGLGSKNQDRLEHYKELLVASVKVGIIACVPTVLIHETASADDWVNRVVKGPIKNAVIRSIDEQFRNPQERQQIQFQQMQEKQQYKMNYQNEKNRLLMDKNLWTSPETVQIATDFIDYAQDYYTKLTGILLSNPNLNDAQVNELIRILQEQFDRKFQELSNRIQMQVKTDLDSGEPLTEKNDSDERNIQKRIKKIMGKIMSFTQSWGRRGSDMELRHNQRSKNQEFNARRRQQRIINDAIKGTINQSTQNIRIKLK